MSALARALGASSQPHTFEHTLEDGTTKTYNISYTTQQMKADWEKARANFERVLLKEEKLYLTDALYEKRLDRILDRYRAGDYAWHRSGDFIKTDHGQLVQIAVMLNCQLSEALDIISRGRIIELMKLLTLVINESTATVRKHIANTYQDMTPTERTQCVDNLTAAGYSPEVIAQSLAVPKTPSGAGSPQETGETDPNG